MCAIISSWGLVSRFNQLIAKLFNSNLTHLKLCLADPINNCKSVKIIRIDKMEIKDFEILLIDVISLACSKSRI